MSVRRTDASSVTWAPPTALNTPPADAGSCAAACTPSATAASPGTDTSSADASSFDTDTATKVTSGTQNPLASLTGDAKVTPMDLGSDTGQKAVNTSYAFLKDQVASTVGGKPGHPELDFTPKSAVQDTLGEVHVRMDKTFKGVPLYGQQLISHVNPAGSVDDVTDNTTGIPDASLDVKPTLTPDDAVQAAEQDFGGSVQNTPEPKLVIYKAPDDSFKLAYQMKLNDFSGAIPLGMNYFVDAKSGAIVDKYNTLDTFLERGAAAAAAKNTTSSSTRKPIAFSDTKPVSSSLHLSKDIATKTATLSLSLTHANADGLTATLTSPSGKTVDVAIPSGTSVATTVDLSAALAGESSKGTWTLKLNDGTAGDSGSLTKWGIKLSSDGTTPPNPPNPPNPPTGNADDQTLYSGLVDVGSTKNADGSFKLSDTTRGSGIATKDLNHGSSVGSAKDITDANNIWGESGDPANQKSAIDAEYAAEKTYDFYKNQFGRDSIDGKGEALNNYVHYSSNYVNAFWDGTEMNYGDGDGQQSGPLTSLDIGGHEITHGFTERTAGLEYSGESGGLNEAMSDIMGKGVQYMAGQTNPAVKFTWGVGEDAWTPGVAGDALRYMNDPTKDNAEGGASVDNYSKYKKGLDVHYSSGIPNNAFYLMVEGGKNKTSGLSVDKGIGMEKALQVMYRAETVYFTPTETFAQAAQACVKAATDLYGAGSDEVKATTQAWTAVGCIK